jgi:hypothetical protein
MLLLGKVAVELVEGIPAPCAFITSISVADIVPQGCGGYGRSGKCYSSDCKGMGGRQGLPCGQEICRPKI